MRTRLIRHRAAVVLTVVLAFAAAACTPPTGSPPVQPPDPPTVWAWTEHIVQGDHPDPGQQLLLAFSYTVDPDGGAPDQVQFQIRRVSDGFVQWDSGFNAIPGVAVPSNALQPSTAYEWTVRVRTSSTGKTSGWAPSKSFATAASSGPPTWSYTVRIVQGDTPDASQQLQLVFSYTVDPAGGAPDQVQFQVRRVSDGFVQWDSGFNAIPGSAVPSNALQSGTAYQWTVRVRTSSSGATSGWAIPASFSTASTTPDWPALDPGAIIRDSTGTYFRYEPGYVTGSGDGATYHDNDAGRPTFVRIPSATVAADLGFDLSGAVSVARVVEPGSAQVLSYPTGGTFLPAGVRCTGSAFNLSSGVGLAVVQARRILAPGPERDAYYGAIACFRQMTNRSIVLRLQLPIDATESVPGGTQLADRFYGELEAFAQLVQELGPSVTPVVTFRGAMTGSATQCAQGSVKTVSTLPDRILGLCQIPSVGLYTTLFTNVRDRFAALVPGTKVWFGAWNEPNFAGFSLMLEPAAAAGSTEWALKRAGEYWKAANSVAPGVVLAGNFAVGGSITPTSLQNLKTYFEVGAGPVPDGRWSLHPYFDISQGASINDPDSKTNSFFGADPLTWLTEVGPLLTKGGPGSETPLNGNGDLQFWEGQRMRGRLESTARSTRVALYGVIGSPAGSFDSAISDSSGRARPFVCGLAGIAKENCPGSVTAGT